MAKKTFGIDNNLLMGAMVLGGGYLIWQSGLLGQVQTAIQGILTPPAAASGTSSVSGSTLNLTGPATLNTMVCPDGSAPNANNICSNGLPALPAGQTALQNQQGGVIPTVSGGADVGGPNVDGPTFTDPTTGLTTQPGAVSLPNFNPFIVSPNIPLNSPGFFQQSPSCPDGSQPDPTLGTCSNGTSVCSAGTRWSQCFQSCQPAGLLEPAPGDPRCVGGGATGTTPCIQTQLCTTNSHWDNVQCACVANAPATTPNQPCSWQYCGPNGTWDSNLCACVPSANPSGEVPVAATSSGMPTTAPPVTITTPSGTPQPAPTAAPTPTTTPTPVTTAPSTTPTPVPITTCPTGYTLVGTSCVQVIQNAPAPTPVAATGSLNCSKSGPGCCNSGHKGNCHSECGFGKNMTSSTCVNCLAVCGTYEGSCNCSTGQAKVAYSYPARMTYQNVGAMIYGDGRKYNQYAKLTNTVPKVTSRSTRYAPQSITNQVFGRRYGYHGRIAVA